MSSATTPMPTMLIPLKSYSTLTSSWDLHKHEQTKKRMLLFGRCERSLYHSYFLSNIFLSLSLGDWSGFWGQENLYPTQTMLSLTLLTSLTNSNQFHCKGRAPDGTVWSLTGQYVASRGGQVHYMFNITYVARFPALHFSAQLDESETTLYGEWGSEDSKPYTGIFIFKRLSPEVMRFYPTPIQLVENKARAMWYFAISATVADVRRKTDPWAWLRKRWQTGQRYTALVTRQTVSPLTAEEVTDLAMCQCTLTPEETHLYQIFRDVRKQYVIFVV